LLTLALRFSRARRVHECSQFFIRVHNETLSIIAMCVSNEDRFPCRRTWAATSSVDVDIPFSRYRLALVLCNLTLKAA